MDKQISKLKNSNFIIGFVLFVQIVGMVLFFRSSNHLQSASIQKINSLVEEVGQLKEENLFLSKQLQIQGDQGNANTITIENVLKKIPQNLSDSELQKNLSNYQQFLISEKSRLESEKDKLHNQLNQSKEQISQLKETKELANAFKSLNEKLYTVLILGENQKLTDTIMLAVVDTQKEKVSLISIPRDLYFEGRKINEYYEFYGIDKISSIVEKITGIQPDKHIVFNFKSFTDLVDSLGGVDIDVDKKIVDNSYPTSDKKYKVVTFDVGLQKMDGERALEYARSRKSTSDFDRSERQQKIIIALKEKLKSEGVLTNIQFLIQTYENISSNFTSNFTALEAIQAFDSYKNYQISAGNVLSNENFLYSTKSTTGQSILLPKSGNYLELQQKILEII